MDNSTFPFESRGILYVHCVLYIVHCTLYIFKHSSISLVINKLNDTERGIRGRCESPYGGIIRIRFNGSDLSRNGTPFKTAAKIHFFAMKNDDTMNLKKNYFCNL